MAHTHTHLLHHCIWSTKCRKPTITLEIEQPVWACTSETASNHGMHVQRVGGIEDHVHMLVELPKTLSIADAMKRIKGGSCNEINRANLTVDKFAWQNGYGAFSVSVSAADKVSDYIAHQRRHHFGLSFHDEYLALLKRHDLTPDVDENARG